MTRRAVIRKSFRLLYGEPWPLTPEDATELGYLLAAEGLLDAARIGYAGSDETTRPAWRRRRYLARILTEALAEDFTKERTDGLDALSRRLTVAQVAALAAKFDYQQED